jgi:3'-phosphoadenosine 5'-phosphosulfate (PAPS) 3'-phosphatase
MTLSDLLPDIVRIARGASRVILEYYDGRIAVDEKRDGSPVTAADRAAEDYIVPELRRLTPDVPVVAEESVHDGKVPEVGDGRFWLVDPLDGTKEFINRNGDFTVNIALIERRVPLGWSARTAAPAPPGRRTPPATAGPSACAGRGPTASPWWPAARTARRSWRTTSPVWPR